ASSKMVYKVTEDIENARYNTAISALMAYVNELYKIKVEDLVNDNEWQAALEAGIMCVAPFAPFMAEELWHQLGHEDTIHIGHWPAWKDEYLVDDMVKVAVQVNGKVRATVEVPADSEEDAAVEIAKADENVLKHLDGQEPKKTIYV